MVHKQLYSIVQSVVFKLYVYSECWVRKTPNNQIYLSGRRNIELKLFKRHSARSLSSGCETALHWIHNGKLSKRTQYVVRARLELGRLWWSLMFNSVFGFRKSMSLVTSREIFSENDFNYLTWYEMKSIFLVPISPEYLFSHLKSNFYSHDFKIFSVDSPPSEIAIFFVCRQIKNRFS